MDKSEQRKIFNQLKRKKELELKLKTIEKYGGEIYQMYLDKEITLIMISHSDKSLKYFDKIISLDLKNTDAEITFIEPREDDKTINRIAKTIETQNKQKVSRVNSVINYISDNNICKSQQLLSYFGESKSTVCGICSVCVEKNKKGETVINSNGIEVVILLLQKEDLSSRDLLEKSMLPEIELTRIIQILLEKNAITVTNYNTYKLVK